MDFVGRMFLALPAVALISSFGWAAETSSFSVDPPRLVLRGAGTSYSLLVHRSGASQEKTDLTRNAGYHTANSKVVSVSRRGVVTAVGDGSTTVEVEVAGAKVQVKVQVEGTGVVKKPGFSSDIEPLLSRHGCNSSGCHGKAEGQNGFKLSVFGFDPARDHAALTQESRGRRVFPSAPEASLLLRKMSGQLPHGGGARLRAGSPGYETVKAWIKAGTPFDDPKTPRVTAVRIEPAERVLAARTGQQLRVIAHFSDGQEADVSTHSRYQSNNESLVTVDADGLVTAEAIPGSAAVMAAYRNHVAVFPVLVPRGGPTVKWQDYPENNFIDRLVAGRLRKLNIQPSTLADDTTFLRRVYLDVIGTLPTVAETRRFLADGRADRRTRLVEELLKRPEFADYWALKWADLLRVDRAALGPKGARAYHRWIRRAMADGMGLDRFARTIVTAEGPLAEGPAANFYKATGSAGNMASTLTQAFLGVRIACAECHHHPFDRWGQDDYHALRAYFAPISVSGKGGTETLEASGSSAVIHPRTGARILARPLGVRAPDKLAPGDRRTDLADWMTSPNNPYFARNLANRIWAHLMGRGLIEPVDDVRETNPPSNPALLDALAKHLTDNKFDIRALIKTITASRTYQLSSKPNETNRRDTQNYSRALFKRLPAEVLLDMVCQTTGVAERFSGEPAGTRAIQLWDSKTPHYFLKTFGRPERASACDCERNPEPGVAQVLHLMNSPDLETRLSHAGGTVARLVKRRPPDGQLVEEIYLTFLNRLPRPEERKIALGHLAAGKDRPQETAEDLAWGLLNTLEFLFNH
jgi:hypothetical protein